MAPFVLFGETGEAAAQHFAHHAEIVARRQILALDVEGPVMRLHEAVRPGDDHRADGVRAHDVGIVVDLDPPQRVFDAKGGGECGEQLFLARAIRQFSAERFARVLRGVIDEVFLFAPLRHRDLDAMSGAFAKRAFEQLALLDVV